MELLSYQIIGQLLLRLQCPQHSRLRPLMLSLACIGSSCSLLPGQAPQHLLLLQRFLLLFHGQYRPQSRDGSGTVIALEPVGDLDLPALHGHTLLIHRADRLDLLRWIVRLLRNIHHISRSLLIAAAERHAHLYARPHRLQKLCRNPVLENPVHLLMCNVYDDIRIPLRHALSSKISRINTRSSIGYFTPFIS